MPVSTASATQISKHVQEQQRKLTDKVKELVQQQLAKRQEIVDLHQALAKAQSVKEAKEIRAKLKVAAAESSKLRTAIKRVAHKRAAALKHAKAQVAARLQKLNAKLDSLKENVAALKASLSEPHADTAAINVKLGLLSAQVTKLQEKSKNLQAVQAKLKAIKITGKFVKMASPASAESLKDAARAVKFRKQALAARRHAVTQKLMLLEKQLSLTKDKKKAARLLARIKRLHRKKRKLTRKLKLVAQNYKRVLAGKPRLVRSIEDKLAEAKEAADAKLHRINARVKRLDKKIARVQALIAKATASKNADSVAALKKLLDSLNTRKTEAATKLVAVKAVADKIAQGVLPTPPTPAQKIERVAARLTKRADKLQKKLKALNDRINTMQKRLDAAKPEHRWAIVRAIHLAEAKFKAMDTLLEKVQQAAQTAREGKMPESQKKRALLQEVELRLAAKQANLEARRDSIQLAILNAKSKLKSLKRGSKEARLFARRLRNKLRKLQAAQARAEKKLATVVANKNALSVGELDSKFLIIASYKTLVLKQHHLTHEIAELDKKINELSAASTSTQPPEKTGLTAKIDDAKEHKAKAQAKLTIVDNELATLRVKAAAKKIKLPTVKPESN